MTDPHRDECRRLHRLIGHYLAIQTWARKLDCIVLTRPDLASLLGLEKFKSARVKWFRADLEPWFPFQVQCNKTGALSSIHSLFLSRVPIEAFVPKGTMTTASRVKAMRSNAPPTGHLRKEGDRLPSAMDMATYNALLAAGLRKP